MNLEELLKAIDDELEERMNEQRRLSELLKENSDICEDVIEQLGLEEKRDVANELSLTEIPVAGRTNWEASKSGLAETSSSNNTYTEEVPLQGSHVDDPETMTVERPSGPSMEDITNWKQEMYQGLAEDTRRKQERANQRDDQRLGAIPTYEYLNEDDTDEVSDIPVAGRRNRDE